MNLILITFLLLAAVSLQTMLPELPIFGSAEWPVLMSIVLCVALRSPRSRVLYASLLAGILNDAFCPAPLGTSLPFFVLFALGIYTLREEIFADQIVSYVVLGLICGLCYVLYFAVVFTLSGLRPFELGLLASRLLGGLILGALTTPLTVIVISTITSKKTRAARWIDA